MHRGTLLLTGATGFVGRAVRPALVAKGWIVRGLTRDAARASAREPGQLWVQGDVSDPVSCMSALQGCRTALYLVHGIGEGVDYQGDEVRAAETFSKAAAAAGIERIVYLGGVAPSGTASEHLRSRLHVGEVLRAGPVRTVELRASMIVGHGSLSWLIVRDLAARLPVMILPRWLESRTEPVAIDDIVVALSRALDLPLDASSWFDVPGPERLSGQDILAATARILGLERPRVLRVPFLTPRLSSLWVRFVTRAKWSVAREVVVGLTEDLLAHDDRFWTLIDHPQRLSFAEAARRALDSERREAPVRGVWGAIERARGLVGVRATRDDGETGAVTPHKPSLALVGLVVWAAAAASVGTLGIWPAIGGAAIVLGAAALLLDGPQSLKLLRPSPRLVLLGVAAGGSMAAATYLFYEILSRALPFIASDTARLYAAFRVPSFAVASLALLPIILGEDLFWRGVVQTAMARHLGPSWGMAVAAGAYALSLLPLGSGLLVLVAFICGLFWGALRARTTSLVPTVAAHLVWDLLILLWLPLSPA